MILMGWKDRLDNISQNILKILKELTGSLTNATNVDDDTFNIGIRQKKC